MTGNAGPSAHSTADHELIVAVANGDLEALGDLFERFEPTLRRYLGRLGATTTDADDLIQATFLEVVGAAGRFDPAYPARNWLLGIATLLLRRDRRSLRRRAAYLAAWGNRLRGKLPDTPHEVLEGDITLKRLARALTDLPLAKREVFVLVKFEGLSGEEVAHTLGIPVRTVWTRLHHARLKLRDALRGLE
jgi:RNA polymerase sigma-70 factor (ECF subfamily)